ncbi:MAG: LytTR family DNA-binding domain-containing protein [Polyangiaceae bacterium]|jgi:DNA-binding LytR/AlgR family response regulator|nr:LytTR family DNA-binding domain-containing protein [Polyangiaceae bacterium]
MMTSGRRLRAFVVEDEAPARDYLVELVQDSGRALVVGAAASGGEAKALLLDAPAEIDVVFVDLCLAEGVDDEAGLDLARALRTLAEPPAIVLATALRTRALEAFELGIDDYLVKPFLRSRVEASLDRVAARRRAACPPAPARFAARRGRALVFLDVDDISALEAVDGLTIVHSARGDFDLDLSLSAVERALGGAFLRTHRNWLVALRHVHALEPCGPSCVVLVEGGARPLWRVPVARERAQAVRATLLAGVIGLRAAPR